MQHSFSCVTLLILIIDKKGIVLLHGYDSTYYHSLTGGSSILLSSVYVILDAIETIARPISSFSLSGSLCCTCTY